MYSEFSAFPPLLNKLNKGGEISNIHTSIHVHTYAYVHMYMFISIFISRKEQAEDCGGEDDDDCGGEDDDDCGGEDDDDCGKPSVVVSTTQ